MDLRRLLVLLFALGVLLWVIGNPSGASAFVHNVIDLFERAAAGLGRFFSNVFAGL